MKKFKRKSKIKTENADLIWAEVSLQKSKSNESSKEPINILDSINENQFQTANVDVGTPDQFWASEFSAQRRLSVMDKVRRSHDKS